MKTRIINKEGYVWEFENFKEAKKHIKNRKIDEYEIKILNKEKVKIYDDRFEY